MIYTWLEELLAYGKEKGLVDASDSIYVRNRLLELFRLNDYKPETVTYIRPIHEILEDLIQYALQQRILEEDTIIMKDLFDTKIMGILTPPPSQIQRVFWEKYAQSPKQATDRYYSFSQATNYIRKDRIEKDEKWSTVTEYGSIDITINLSKPEKDPRDIVKAGTAKKTGYPSCLLCKENEGYAGHLLHPARQNHRIIPLTLAGSSYYMQYSPYVYYNEHCILFSDKHEPMKIDKSTFEKLLDFVRQFPHYTAGSNADLPIVGGSILSHDHFQGGNYTFAMAKAPYETMFELKDYRDVTAGTIYWPMSVIRLRSKDAKELADAANDILKKWRCYTDEKADIYCETEGTPHNTITPIARIKDGMFELDLVLRNNRTTEEYPMGVFHPHEEYHHIKKENIGLIEVMGLAVLPSRLKQEMLELEKDILENQNLYEIETISKHAEWVDTWRDEYRITEENIHAIIQEEIGKTFVKILECAGVFKRTPEGKEAFGRLIAVLSRQ